MTKSAMTIRAARPPSRPSALAASAVLVKQNHARRVSPAQRGNLAALAESASKHTAFAGSSKCLIVRPDSSMVPVKVAVPTGVESTSARVTSMFAGYEHTDRIAAAETQRVEDHTDLRARRAGGVAVDRWRFVIGCALAREQSEHREHDGSTEAARHND